MYKVVKGSYIRSLSWEMSKLDKQSDNETIYRLIEFDMGSADITMWHLCCFLFLIQETLCDEVISRMFYQYSNNTCCILVEICSRGLETWRPDADILLPDRSLQRQVLLFLMKTLTNVLLCIVGPAGPWVPVSSPAQARGSITSWASGWGQGRVVTLCADIWLTVGRYGELLGEEYSEEEVLVRSTDTDRTLMSGQVSLAGNAHLIIRFQ